MFIYIVYFFVKKFKESLKRVYFSYLKFTQFLNVQGKLFGLLLKEGYFDDICKHSGFFAQMVKKFIFLLKSLTKV